jgi:malate dehydrogenase (oxaloacetate-decarboxylating)(NADP+)
MANDFDEMSLEYHRFPRPGKISVEPTKRLQNQRDLSLAYSPGVAAACNLIVADPGEAANMTSRANLVGVVTNGTAVLGLGAIGPLASKPVMEGKAVLFKKFAGVDVFDIELDELDPDKLVDIVVALEPTFGGVNLEDIKAPECFIVEKKCRERMNIPVFHDDQHGTAITVAAAVHNGLHLVGKKIEDIKIVCSGAGAAALACLNLLVSMGADRDKVFVSDIEGVVYEGREKLMDEYKGVYAQKTDARVLDDVIADADVFLGLSAPGVLTGEMVRKMAADPLVLALANPVPEILPEDALAARDDVVLATGRSDYPNQVNNVLCFPFLFRGALDVGATEINETMKIACVEAIAALARAEPSDIVQRAYTGESLRFGRDYILPKPFDPRLIAEVAPAVAKAAMESGVATRPIEDFTEYKRELNRFIFRSGQTMEPIFATAKRDPKRVIFAEGEDERILQAVQIIVDDGLAQPILVGRMERLADMAQSLGLRIRPGDGFEVIDPTDAARQDETWRDYHRLMMRRGVTEQSAKVVVRTRQTAIAALAVHRGEADAMICGVYGSYQRHLKHVRDIIPLRDGVRDCSALRCLITNVGTVFIADTNVSYDPSADEIAEMAILAAEELLRFGVKPKVGLISHSNFGAVDSPSAVKMRAAYKIARERAPDLEIEGEMHADTAMSTIIRKVLFPDSELRGPANLLIMPNIDAAHIAFTTAKVLTEGLSIGPMLIGLSKPVHVVTSSITVRGIVNMTAVAVADAQSFAD